MPNRSSKRPSDPNQLAKLVVAIAIGDAQDQPEAVAARKNPAAVALGRLGGQKGGSARAAKLTAEERHDIAARAAAARWKHDR